MSLQKDILRIFMGASPIFLLHFCIELLIFRFYCVLVLAFFKDYSLDFCI
ncbi:hypothetical protein Ahy_B08g089633 isoform A [Arachis hypogaea]|uniref:Uncharacterized protein n=1 Tax=Arachis hypogaea TaxID=3818 RepID=A0A444XYE6_ARAHY|nr:hypothetical protein Ahy_B08g089633 isoform A [Arachis hypogaea]